MSEILFEPLTLPNGVILPNRLAKAAMEENLSEYGQVPGEGHVRLYHRWAKGGAGLIITGNVMISPDALTGPGGVVLEKGVDLSPFKAWAQAGRANGAQFWMQISHPGRQMYEAMGERAVSASDIAIDLGSYSKMFAQPRALRSEEIRELVERFATTARLAEEAGFTGVEIHGAHGYLVSQFLSPLTNRRTDEWGGTLENRARFLLEIVAAVRGAVSPEFCVAVKLNSADFQKGGFDEADAKWVVEQLNSTGTDLVELSGGSYESPAMQGETGDSSTAKREAYFVDFARDIAKIAKMPIMVTGGIRRQSVATSALMDNEAGFAVSVLGIARALAFEPALVKNWRDGRTLSVSIPEVKWKNRTLAGVATMAVTAAQLHRMAKGKNPKPSMIPLLAMISGNLRTKKLTKRYRRWRNTTR